MESWEYLSGDNIDFLSIEECKEILNKWEEEYKKENATIIDALANDYFNASKVSSVKIMDYNSSGKNSSPNKVNSLKTEKGYAEVTDGHKILFTPDYGDTHGSDTFSIIMEDVNGYTGSAEITVTF